MIYNYKTKPSGQYFSVIMLSEVVPHFKSVSEKTKYNHSTETERLSSAFSVLLFSKFVNILYKKHFN